MKIFTVKYFSTVDWHWYTLEVLAESRKSVEALVDSRCTKQYRDKPYRRNRDEVPLHDTLAITEGAEMKLPYVLNGENF